MPSLESFLDPRKPPAVVAILNVTPDSFFDGGALSSVDAVTARALECVQEGADVLELGAESTGPGSPDVSADEELARLLPALRAVRSAVPDIPISIDTYKSVIADASLREGADCINDVAAGRADSRMFSVIAERNAYCVLMFSKDATPRTTRKDVEYDNVLTHVRLFLEERIESAVRAGIDRTKIIVDPGLGHFVSSLPQYSFQILENLDVFGALGPVLVSPSRKSFLAGPQNLPPAERLPATLEASITAAKHGARFIRTHDIAATKRALGTL